VTLTDAAWTAGRFHGKQDSSSLTTGFCVVFVAGTMVPGSVFGFIPGSTGGKVVLVLVAIPPPIPRDPPPDAPRCARIGKADTEKHKMQITTITEYEGRR
jgi:hypothetical protein